MKNIGKKYLISTTVLSSFLAAVTVFAAVVQLMPVSDVQKDWDAVPENASLTHASRVDDAPCNGNTDLVVTRVLDERDSYNLDLSSIPNGSSITEMQISPCAANAIPPFGGWPAGQIKPFYILNGGSFVYGPSYTMVDTIPTQMVSSTFSFSPPISKDASTTIVVGVELTGGARGARVSNLMTKITY